MIYLDDSATTSLDPRVLESMMPYLTTYYGNASATHSFGQKSKYAIDESRYSIARFLGATPQEIIFTSTGSESISLAIKGTAEYFSTLSKEDNKRNKFEPEHVYIITSPMEHSAVINTVTHLQAWGYKNKLIGVNSNGHIKMYSNEDKGNLLSLETTLRQIKDSDPFAHIIVSVQYVNAETGAIQNISEISRIAHDFDAKVHTDAMQAAKLMDISVNILGVDMMTFAAHKIYGPIGAAALYLKTGSKISRQIDGGEQEYKVRAGTQNASAIVGFGKAIEILMEERNDRFKRIENLSNLFISNLKKEILGIKILSEDIRMPSIISILFPNIKATEFLVRLDIAGVIASAGSACNSGSIQPTANLSYMGLDDKEINSVIRFSLGKNSTTEEINESCKIISKEYYAYIRTKENRQ